MKILIIGPESSGKSTLCKNIAERYGFHQVKEFGRFYTEDLISQDSAKINFEDFLLIAKMQEKYIEESSKLFENIVVDTDAITTAVFYKMFSSENNSFSQENFNLILHLSNIVIYDLVIHLFPDEVPVQDGTRTFLDEKRRKNHNDEITDYHLIKLAARNMANNYHYFTNSFATNRQQVFKLIDFLYER